MNAEALVFISGLTQAIAYSSWNLFKLWKSRKHKNEIFCIVSARHTGISTCINNIRNDNREFRRAILVDEDDVLNKQSELMNSHLRTLRDTNQDSYMCEIFPLIRKHLQNLKEIHGSKPIIFFTSLQNLPQFLGIKDKRCLIAYTSGDFHKSLCDGLTSEGYSEEDIKVMNDTRDLLLSQKYERIKYNSFGDLRRLLEALLFSRNRL